MAGPLDRFVTAQEVVFDQALAELKAGSKRSHWMWFVFPQIAGLGRSAMAQHYAIANLAEARAYLDHPVLGPRLVEITYALLVHEGTRTAAAILGDVDALKLRSSMTLFEVAGGGTGPFGAVLDAFYTGERDRMTSGLLA